jgi:hypothetical protein
MCFKNPLSKKSYSLPQQHSDDEEPSTKVQDYQKNAYVAMQIIELEIQLEHHCTLELVHKLADLYTHAIEFFDDKDDPKCFDIQNKLHRMLKRPDVIEILNSPADRGKVVQDESFEQKKQSFERRKRTMASSLNQTLEHINGKSGSCSEFIDHSEGKAQKISDLIVNSFDQQEKALHERLETRKRVMNERRASFLNMSGTIEKSDMSAGFDKELLMQNEIEEFLETHFAQQTTAVSEVNVKYEIEIKSIDGQGGVMAMVVDELRKNRDSEVQTIKTSFEKAKKEGVNAIKQKYMSTT